MGSNFFLYINAHSRFLQVTDMAETAFYLEITSQDLFNRFCFRRTLDNQQIFRHNCSILYITKPLFSGRKVEQE